MVPESIVEYREVLALHPAHCEARFNLVEALYQVT
jgi:hypothetical protein